MGWTLLTDGERADAMKRARKGKSVSRHIRACYGLPPPTNPQRPTHTAFEQPTTLAGGRPMIAAALAAEAGSGTQGTEGPSAVPAYVHRFMNYARTSAEGRALIRDSSASSSAGPPGVLAAGLAGQAGAGDGGGGESVEAALQPPHHLLAHVGGRLG